MFGNERMDAVYGTMEGSVRFYGMTPTSMKLEGLDRHQRLIDSYKEVACGAGESAINKLLWAYFWCSTKLTTTSNDQHRH